MIKTTLSILIFICTLNSFAQSNDTIFLKEITIKKPSKKIKYIKTKGSTSSLQGSTIKSVISRMDKLPSGRMSSIKLYFNQNSSWFPIDYEMDYRDVTLGLLIYNIKEDGSPGEPIIDKDIRFLVPADHHDTIELDLEPLHLNTMESMYFGFELLKQQSGEDFRIMLTENSTPSYAKFWNSDKESNFRDSDIPCGIKMALGIRLTN